MAFGQRIRERRRQLGWIQDTLATKAGISKSFLSDVENEKRGISADTLLDLSRVLGVSLDSLMTGAASRKDKAEDVEIPAPLARFAAEAGISFRQTLLLLELQRVILAQRIGATRPSLDGVDWRKFYEAVKEFL